MPWRQSGQVRVQCFPNGKSWLMRIAGYLLIAAGAVLILLCVPVWDWLAAIGAALVMLGWLISRN